MRRAICSVASSRSGLGAFAMDDPPYPDKFQETDHIPEPYLTAIGRVVIHWCNLEAVTDLAIGKLAGFDAHDSRSAIVPAHMSWPQKMDVLESLVNVLRDQHTYLAKFDDVKPLLKKAQEGRNRLVHGQWGRDGDQVVKLRLTARGKLKFGITPIALDEIKAIGIDIGQAGFMLLKTVLGK
jgi:hypothetical protein